MSFTAESAAFPARSRVGPRKRPPSTFIPRGSTVGTARKHMYVGICWMLLGSTDFRLWPYRFVYTCFATTTRHTATVNLASYEGLRMKVELLSPSQVSIVLIVTVHTGILFVRRAMDWFRVPLVSPFSGCPNYFAGGVAQGRGVLRRKSGVQ